MNNFEQVFSDGHQMPLAGDRAGASHRSHIWSGNRGWGWCPYTVGSHVDLSWVGGHMGPPAMNTLTDGQTRMKT